MACQGSKHNVQYSLVARVAIALSLSMFTIVQVHATDLILSQPSTGDVVAYNNNSFLVSGLSHEQPQL
ncbi:MAG: hypothetical protein ACI808_003236, partial [Paraglaciecola sp.]